MDHTFLFYCPVFLVGISESDQMEIYQILVSILHLSNVEIKSLSADRSSISVITDYTWTRFLFLLYFTLEYCIEDGLRLFPQRSLLLMYFQPDNVHLMVFCELMGIPCKEMAHWLCHRTLKTTTKTYVKSLSKVNAVNGRDALAKHIYAKLFSLIVGRINNALNSAVKQHSFIGVLDIYG